MSTLYSMYKKYELLRLRYTRKYKYCKSYSVFNDVTYE